MRKGFGCNSEHENLDVREAWIEIYTGMAIYRTMMKPVLSPSIPFERIGRLRSERSLNSSPAYLYQSEIVELAGNVSCGRYVSAGTKGI